ncbi:MAG: TonB-dependent receptor [Pigmentiphaga sp.]
MTENSGTYAAQSSTVGGKLALPLKETPRSVSVLGRQQLDDQNLTTIDGALEKATGVYVRTEGDMSDGPFFYARGFAMSVAENGMPFDTTYYGGGLDTSVYDRIEVLRGPDGLMQGQGQLGGTVNLVRKRPLPYDQRKVQGMAGSNRHLSGSLDVSQVLNTAGTLRGRAVLSAENSDGFVSHTGREQYLGYGILEADLAPSTMVSIHLLAQRTNTNPYFGGLYDGEQYTPRGQYGGARWSRYAFDREEAGLGVRHRFTADWSLSADVHYRRYDNQKRFAFHNPHPAFGSNGGQSALINRATWFAGNQRTADMHLNGRFRTGARTHEVVVGANVERYDFRNWTRNAPSVGMWTFGNAEVPYVELERPDSSDSHVSQTGIYVQGNVELADGLNLHLGGRYSKYRSERTSPAGVHRLLYDESNVFTPYGGLVWKLNDQISVYASYADIFRPQSAGSEDASGKLLDPLVGKQVEVGANMGLFQDRVNARWLAIPIRGPNIQAAMKT